MGGRAIIRSQRLGEVLADIDRHIHTNVIGEFTGPHGRTHHAHKCIQRLRFDFTPLKNRTNQHSRCLVNTVGDKARPVTLHINSDFLFLFREIHTNLHGFIGGLIRPDHFDQAH